MNDPHKAIGIINELVQTTGPTSSDRPGNYAAVMALLTELERHVSDSESRMKGYDHNMISRLRGLVNVHFGFDVPEENTSSDVLDAIYETLARLKNGFF